MKKLITLILVFALLTVSAQAKLEHFTTPIDLSVSNGTMKFVAEDLQSRTYSCSTDVNESIAVNLYRNTTCNENELFTFLKSTTLYYNDTDTFQNKYNTCVVESAELNANAYYEENVTYRTKYDTCTTQLATLQSTNSALQKYKSNNESNNNKSDNTPIIWGIAGIGIGWLIWGKDKKPKSPIKKFPEMGG